MSNEVIDRVKQKYPAYQGKPDREIGLAIGRKYPAYLAHPAFRDDFHRYERGEQLRAEKLALESGPQPSVLGELGEIAKDVGGQVMLGAAGVLASIPEAVGRSAQALERKFGDGEASEDLDTLKLADAIRKGASKLAGEIDPDVAESFMLGTFPQALGSMAGFMAGGLAGQAAKLSGAATVASLGAAAGGAEGYQRAKMAGADDELAWESFAANALVGTSEAVPVAGILSKLNKASGNLLGRALTDATAEAVQEAGQALSADLIADTLTPGDVRGIAETLEQGAAGGLTGFLTSVLANVAARRAGVRVGGQQQQGAESGFLDPVRAPEEKLVEDQAAVLQSLSEEQRYGPPPAAPAASREELNEQLQYGPPEAKAAVQGALLDLQVLEARGLLGQQREAARRQVLDVAQAEMQEADAEIDRIETELEAEGVDIDQLFDPTKGGQPEDGWSPMPARLKAAYEQREAARKKLAAVPEAAPAASAAAPLEAQQQAASAVAPEAAAAGAGATGQALDTASQILASAAGSQQAVQAAAEGATAATAASPASPITPAPGTPAADQPAALPESFPPIPSATPTKGLKGEVRDLTAEEQASLGIMPPGGAAVQDLLNRLAPPLAPGQPPAMQIDTSTIAPDFQPYSVAQEVATRPHGIGRVRGLGWLFDPRAKNLDPTEKGIVTRAFEVTVGRAVATSLGQQLTGKIDNAFAVDERGKITNVQTTKPDAPLHIADFFEELQKNPKSYLLTPEQQQAAKLALNTLGEITKLQRKYKLVQPDLEGPDAEVGEQERKTYFPRIVIGVREGGKARPLDRRRSGKGTAVGAKQSFQKTRLFKTEQQGAGWDAEKQAYTDEGKIYEPSIEKRLVTLLDRTYRAAADKRLADNPALAGETMADRRQRYKAQFAKELASGELTEKDVNNIAESLREDERYVSQPAFSGKVYPKEIAEALNDVYGVNESRLRRWLADLNSAAKGIGFGLDFAAPFIQGQVMMFRNPARWAKATKLHLEAFASPEVMRRYLSNPDNLQAMRELSQLGVPLGTLQDYMASLEAEGLLGRAPVIGQVFERFARSFSTFTETATVELWKSWRQVAPREQWPAVAETIQNMLLRGKMDEIGVSRNRALLERVLFLAPAYLRGGVSLVASINESGVSGKIARQALGAWALGGALVLYGFFKWLDLSDEEILERLNPASSNFMMVPVQFPDGRTRNVGIGGILRSMMRLAGDVTESVLTGDGRITSLGMENPVLRWLRGKLAPVPGFVSDAWLGQDFLGNDITPMEALRARIVPLGLQQIWTRPGEPPATISDVFPSMLGLQIWPESQRSTLGRERDKAAKELGYESYESAPLKAQNRITFEILARPEMKKPPVTEHVKVMAIKADEERRERIMKKLPEEIQERLKELDLRILSYDTSLNFGKDRIVPLTKNQIERYEELIVEAFSNALGQLPWDKLATFEPSIRQDIVTSALSGAKARARGWYMREQARKEEEGEGKWRMLKVP